MTNKNLLKNYPPTPGGFFYQPYQKRKIMYEKEYFETNKPDYWQGLTKAEKAKLKRALIAKEAEMWANPPKPIPNGTVLKYKHGKADMVVYGYKADLQRTRTGVAWHQFVMHGNRGYTHTHNLILPDEYCLPLFQFAPLLIKLDHGREPTAEQAAERLRVTKEAIANLSAKTKAAPAKKTQPADPTERWAKMLMPLTPAGKRSRRK